jgi:UDP-N-acetylglucosamine 2-epimerase (non-hydrolysing)
VLLSAQRFSGTIPLAHVESGLRSLDLTMPEEINRIVTDVLSEYLFVTEKIGVTNLVKEGISKKKIFLTGDTMIDSLSYYKHAITESDILERLELRPHKYILSTIHRPANVDNKANFKKVIDIFGSVSEFACKSIDFRIVLPVHPRTLKMAEKFGLYRKLRSIPGIKLVDPAGYIDFIRLLRDSMAVITDSGGIQEEATFLGIPCLTLRDSFERPETLTIGTNTLCRLDEALVMKKIREIFGGNYKKGRIPELMDGKAASRIVNIIKSRP